MYFDYFKTEQDDELEELLLLFARHGFPFTEKSFVNLPTNKHPKQKERGFHPQKNLQAGLGSTDTWTGAAQAAKPKGAGRGTEMSMQQWKNLERKAMSPEKKAAIKGGTIIERSRKRLR